MKKIGNIKNKKLKLVFLFLLIIFATLNVNAGTTTDSCGKMGRLTVKMTSDGEDAGFDAREYTCQWVYSGMADMGNFSTPSSLIRHATEFITTTVTTTSPSGKGSVTAGYTYQRCTDPRAETSATGTCTKDYTGTAHWHDGYCDGEWSDDGDDCEGTWYNGYYTYSCDEPNSSGGGDSSSCTRTETKSFGPVTGPVTSGAATVNSQYNSWASGFSGFSCSKELSYKCPSYTCQSTPFNFRACTPRFKDANGNEVYCINPDQLFTTGANVAGSEAVYGIDDFDVTKCKYSYSTVDCGFANILIEGQYYKQKGVLGYNEINLALRLWSYYTNRGGFDGVGLSWVTAKYGTGGSCSLGANGDNLFIPPYYNVYDGTYKKYFEAALNSIAEGKKYISPTDNLLSGLAGCDGFGFACNTQLSTVNKAFALLLNTIKGNPYMFDHLAELFPEYTGTPTGVSFEPSTGDEDKTDVIVEYGPIFNNWTRDVWINCDSLVPGTDEYNQVKPYCKVRIKWYDAQGVAHETKPSSCKKSVGCRYEKLSLAFCDVNEQKQLIRKIYIHHPRTKVTTSIAKLENCNTVNAQMMFSFIYNDKVKYVDPWSEVDPDEDEWIPYNLPSYSCKGNCDNYNLRKTEGTGLSCKYDGNKEDGGIFTGYIKDPSLNCILNMPAPREKYKYDYSQEFGVNTNFCRVYCSDEVEYTLADKITVQSGKDFKLDIAGKINFGDTKNKLLTNVVTEKRTCVSEIYYSKSFSSVIDWKTLYDLDENPDNISQLYDALLRKSSSENNRTENLNQVLYDLYACNFYTKDDILSTGLTRPKENTNGDVITYALDKYFSPSKSYGLAINKDCLINDSTNTCIVMDTITYTGGAEYYGTNDRDNNNIIKRFGDGDGVTKIDVGSLAKQELSSIGYCHGNNCFKYNENNDLDYSYINMGSYTPHTKRINGHNVPVPENDYAFFTIKTDVAFYNDTLTQTVPGSGHIINKKSNDASEKYIDLPAFSFPTSKDAYLLCEDDTKTIRNMNTGLSSLETHSCEVKYKFANVNTYYRKNYPDNFSRAVQEEYMAPSCYYDAMTNIPNTPVTSDKCLSEGNCTEYKNVNKTKIFPNGIPVDTNWDDEWSLKVKQYLEDTAKNMTDTENLEYSITLTPTQIKALRQYNKTNSNYQNAIINCPTPTTGHYYNCESQFMIRMREGSSTNGSYDYGSLNPNFNGTTYYINSETKTINNN